MKRFFLILAVSGLVLMSCGKKAEPVQEVTPVPEAIVEQEVTPEAPDFDTLFFTILQHIKYQ